ncbi:MAG: hypothetical protein IPG99_12805 [Ignavibacteria bacterium]|nr:hypothetical protein [Ignavibacteria bacterium]
MPQPASEYLNDRTAFDAYFEYFTKETNHGIIGVEVKFTEPFSQKVYDTSRYRELVETPVFRGRCSRGPNCPTSAGISYGEIIFLHTR